MTRPLDPATSIAVGNPVLPISFALYLDILDDPLFAWAGIGDLVFGAGATGDAFLDGKTFYGTGHIVEISNISDGAGGSDALEVSLQGVDPLQPAMRQIMTNRNRWQFRRAIAWMIALDPETLAPVGKPFRLKTGRMDRMPYTEDKDGGKIKCKIEGQQAYTNRPLSTRYSEQRDINPNDTSQKFVHALANRTPELGVSSATSGNSASSGSSVLVPSWLVSGISVQ
jgi:hypothetical protein